MTKEEKDLLFKDLCARLLYGIKISTHDGSQTMVGIICTNGGGKVYTSNMLYNISQVKPYLRPILSMTEEERAEFYKVGGIMSHKVETDTYVLTAFSPDAYDWLNKKMFDYRGLIKKGFALVAPKGMYKVEE